MNEAVTPPERKVSVHGVPDDSGIIEHRGMRIDPQKLIDLTDDVPAETADIRDVLALVGDYAWKDKDLDDTGVVTPKFIVNACVENGYEPAAMLYPNLEHHIRQIQNSDTAMPILIYEKGILDGMHRLCKAVIEKQPTVTIKNLEEIPEAALIRNGS